MKHRLSIFVSIFASLSLFAQDINLPQGYFRHPLDLTPSFSGTFAEFRSNHFHSGLDLRIGGVVGAPVRAAAAGYVSRINISPWGGGKVLYITHPNGYKTVYMHLNDFTGDIARWVRDYQYEHQCYAFDQNIPEGLLPVSQGQVVAHAGNTGSSGGPHLHYEIRIASTDETINPFRSGMKFSDPVAPTIRGIKVYPLNSAPIDVDLNPKVTPEIQVGGTCYFGIYATDVSENSVGRNGIDRIELYVDGVLFHRYQMSSFRFEHTRAINAIIDYPFYSAHRQAYLVSRRLPGDPSSFSQPQQGDGTLFVAPGTTHSVEYRVFDYKGNRSSRSFTLRGVEAPPPTDSRLQSLTPQGTAASFAEPFSYSSADFSVSLEPHTLYADDFMLHSSCSDSRFLSPLHTFRPKLHNLPPHQTYNLRIRIPRGCSRPASQLLIVSVSGSKIVAASTRVQDGWLSAPMRSFGSFAVTYDDQPPKVKLSNLNKKGFLKGNLLRVRISDNLAGVDTYHCYINGEWVLAEFDGKTAQLIIDGSGRWRTGNNKFRILLTDACGNTTDLTYDIRK